MQRERTQSALSHDILAPVRAQGPELVSGSGAELFDAEGRRYIALNELSVCLGAGNRHFIEVMQQALSRPAQSGAVNPYKARLYERLLEVTNGDFSYIHLTSSGSEAAEWAVKLARKLTGKTEVVSYWNSIHGRTQLSASMSGLPKRKTGYGPLDPGVLFTPYPDCLHCPFHCEPQSCRFACLDFLSQQVTFGSAQEIAAVVIELCQGASHLCPPPGYLRALRAWTRERGALLIFDEIQSGMGRTGRMFRYQAEGVVPDFLLIGKALGNGLHIAGFLTSCQPEKQDLYALSGGSGDAVLSCAAACAVFDELCEGGLLDNIRTAGARLRAGLERCTEKYDKAVQARGEGLALALECAGETSAAAVHNALHRDGYLCGRTGTALVFKPPFVLTPEQADEVAAAVDRAFAAL